jgi:hypothetical protein
MLVRANVMLQHEKEQGAQQQQNVPLKHILCSSFDIITAILTPDAALSSWESRITRLLLDVTRGGRGIKSG